MDTSTPFLSMYLVVKLLRHRVGQCLALGDTTWLFSQEAVPIYTPPLPLHTQLLRALVAVSFLKASRVDIMHK